MCKLPDIKVAVESVTAAPTAATTAKKAKKSKNQKKKPTTEESPEPKTCPLAPTAVAEEKPKKKRAKKPKSGTVANDEQKSDVVAGKVEPPQSVTTTKSTKETKDKKNKADKRASKTSIEVFCLLALHGVLPEIFFSSSLLLMHRLDEIISKFKSKLTHP